VSPAKPRIRPLWWPEKTRSFVSSPKISFSTHFWPETPRKHHIDLVKPIHDHQKANKPPQNPKSTWKKILLKLKFVVLGVFKVNKHLIVTPFIIWNLLTQKSTILVVEIFLSNYFLSLRWNLVTPSLSSQYKRLKQEKNKVRYQNVLFSNSRDLYLISK
jgi:hypothetical protein